MGTIIALRGKGNSGKTTTIRLLYDLLLSDGYSLMRSNFSVDGGDYIAIFKKKGKLIGVTSSGDTYDLVHKRLQEMVDEGCDICVCACRTFDRTPGEGTNAAITEFTNYSSQFIPKTVDENVRTRPSSNNADANELFKHIEQHV